MLLSIIIPAYNAEKTITECIESIEKNNSADYEIVIVDDGSTDCQNEKIHILQEKYSNVKLYSQQNTGGLGRDSSDLRRHSENTVPVLMLMILFQIIISKQLLHLYMIIRRQIILC